MPASLLADWMVVLCGCLLGLTLLMALRCASWRSVAGTPGRMHLVAGGAVACLLLWLLNIHLLDGLMLHFLGITALTLVVGWSFSVLGASLAMIAFYGLQNLDWGAFPLSVLLCVVIPATTSWLLARALHRQGLRHPFVYMLGAGFAGGAVVVLVLALVVGLLFWALGLAAYLETAGEFWPFIVLLMFSEGFINGMCVSALAIFHPDWMKTFDEKFYFDDRR